MGLAFLKGNGKILELDNGDDCTAMRIYKKPTELYTLKGDLWYVDYISIKPLLKF